MAISLAMLHAQMQFICLMAGVLVLAHVLNTLWLKSWGAKCCFRS